MREKKTFCNIIVHDGIILEQPGDEEYGGYIAQFMKS